MYVLRHCLAILIAMAVPIAMLSVPLGAAFAGSSGAGGGALVALVFGGLAALLLGTLSVWRQRSKGLTLSEPLGPRQQMLVPAPPAMSVPVQQAELVALLEAAGYKPTRDPVRRDCLTARTSTTLWSFGVKIRVCTDGRVVTLLTRPALATTITDYGEGRLVLQRLTRQLKDRWDPSPSSGRSRIE